MELITGVVRDYDWGHHDAIASLLGHEPPGHPEAEYWLGAHPSAPSQIVGGERNLAEVIAQEPVPVLGREVSERFGGLPFLLKVLAAERPLSIQAHPSLAQAKAGFARENEAGVDVAAANRSYRDDNHKPELICALTPFEAKCGFRPLAECRRLIGAMADCGRLISTTPDSADGLRSLADRLDAEGNDGEVLSAVVSWLLRLPADQARALADVATRLQESVLIVTSLDWTNSDRRWSGQSAWPRRFPEILAWLSPCF